MKKQLLSLFAAVACVATAAASDFTYDFLTNDYGMERGNNNVYNPEDFVISDPATSVTITPHKGTGNGSRLWSDGLRFYSHSSFTVANPGGTMSEIVITFKNAAALNGFDFDGEGYTKDETAKTGTWTGSAAELTWTCNITKSNVAISSIKITYEGGQADTREDAGLAFSADKVTATMGQPFTAPTLTKDTTAPVTYSSDKETVATVDATTGEVTLVGEGTARITATAEANELYKAGSASYLLTVEAGAPEGAFYYSAKGVDFTFENPEGLEVWKHDNTYGLKGSAYISSKTNAASAVAFVALDLTTYQDVTVDFDQAFNNYKLNGENIPVADFMGYADVVVREQGATEWTKVADAKAPEAFSWTFYANGPVDLKAYDGKKIELGFRYISTAEVAGTWEVQKIAAYGTAAQVGIADIEATNAPVEYYNLQGQRIANPQHGLFIKKQGNTVTKVIVK